MSMTNNDKIWGQRVSYLRSIVRMKLLLDSYFIGCMTCMTSESIFWYPGRQVLNGKEWMHTQSELCCQRQQSMFRANYQQIQGCFQLCSGWNESFPWAASESLLKQREHFLPISSDIHFWATKRQEMEGYIRYCPCCISSLVNTGAWFPCLSIWCFSPVYGNSSLSCILIFTIAQCPWQNTDGGKT